MPETAQPTNALSWRAAWRCPSTWIVAVLSLGLLGWVLWRASPEKVWQSLQSADYTLLMLGVPIILLGLVLRAMRWRILLMPLGKPSFWASFRSLGVGYLGNNLLPARAGELVRAYILGQQFGISKSSIFGTIVFERAIDASIMLLALVSLTIVFPTSAWMVQIASGGAVAIVGVIVVMIAIRTCRERIVSLLRSLLYRLPERWQMRGVSLANDFFIGLTSFRSVTDALLYTAATIMVWSGEVLVFWIVMHAFGISLTLPAVLFVLAAAALSTAIPALPGYVGTYQFAVVNVLMLLGVVAGPATAFALGIHGLTWLTVNTIGAWIVLGMLKDFRLIIGRVDAEPARVS